jgi:protein-ribulosamine 3-kinase
MSLAAALSRALGCEVAADSQRRVSGGSINSCSRFESSRGPLFVKHGGPASLEMFQAEAEGLAELGRARCVRVPEVLAVGERDGVAFLALEWIELHSGGAGSEQKLGELLAAQHRVTRSKFGWHRDNSIGSTPQANRWTEDWVEFLRQQRLRPQLLLARDNGAEAKLIDSGERLCEQLGCFFTDYRPLPSLLHGDLWGGNWGADSSGQPVLFDPAVYFGDREADLAMTRLFGGFGAAFYAAYQATWPLDSGASARVELYNLYHVLNHFNLFGGAYARQALTMTQRLLAALK